MLTSLEDEDGAALLLDFEAAFPSIAHQYIHRTLEHRGLPAAATGFVQALYTDNIGHLVVAGRKCEHFAVHSGIRQGCPLSPLLYVVIGEALLNALTNCAPGGTVSGYADDTALVLQSLPRDLPRVQRILQQFETVSGLKIHPQKTVIIPLGDRSPDDVRNFIQKSVPRWSEVQIKEWAIYLGVAIGPRKADHSWDGCLEKAQKEVLIWPWARLGLQYSPNSDTSPKRRESLIGCWTCATA